MLSLALYSFNQHEFFHYYIFCLSDQPNCISAQHKPLAFFFSPWSSRILAEEVEKVCQTARAIKPTQQLVTLLITRVLCLLLLSGLEEFAVSNVQ